MQYKKGGIMKKLLITAIATLAFAKPELDSGNTAWMMISTALVMLMTPAGLALFYAGMTRSKNILNTYMMVFSAYALATVIWVFWGYSLTFGDDIAGIIGNLKYLFLNGISYSDLESSGYPSFVFIAFQGTFAAITVAIASGSIIERTKFSTWLLFVVLWVTFVYAPVAHMVWGGGFLYNDGALDFAGGTVVHMNGGLAGLIAAIMIGKRRGYPKSQMMPSSVILTALGAALLWFGWFGFNGGSEFAADEIAGSAFLITNFAAAAATVTWIILDYIKFGKPTLLGAASGAIAGLVAITPAAGFVNVVGALIIGIGGSISGFLGVTWLKKVLKYDDSLDAFGIHFIAGLWGAVATGFFALKDLAWEGSPLHDKGDRLTQIWVQIESVLVTIIFVTIMTAIVLKIASLLTGKARVSEEAEIEGLDSTEHGEKGFNL
jgi:Amt family ammonium transporter